MKKIFNALFDMPFDTMGLAPKTLRFGTLREVSYLKERKEHSYLRNRLLLLVAGVIFGLFYFFAGLKFQSITYALIPAGIAIISYFGSFAATSMERFERRLPLIYTLAGAGGMASVLAFTAVPAFTSFYGDLLFILSVVVMMMLSINWLWSVGVSVLGLLLYIVHSNVQRLHTAHFASDGVGLLLPIVILTAAYLFIMISAYFQEYERRKNFYQRKYSKASSEKLADTVIKKVQNPVNKMFDSVMDVVFFITLEGDIKYISKSVKEFLGYEPGELIGKRSITLMSKASHKQFEVQTSRLYHDLNLVQTAFDYKTKAGLLKKGEAIIKAYSDNKYGDGFIGSVRPLTDIRAKELAEDVRQLHELTEERDALKIENQRLSHTLDDLKIKIDKLVEQSLMVKAMNSSDFSDFLEGNSDFMDAYVQKNNQAHVELLSQLKLLFESKRMGKYDLKHYIKHAEQTLNYAQDATKLYDAYKLAMVFMLHHTSSHSLNNLKKSLEKSVVACAELFMGTEHIVEIKCPSDVMVHIDEDALKQYISLMISGSMFIGFKTLDKGKITISVFKDDDGIKLTYTDNGETLPRMPFESVFIDSYFSDVCDEYPSAESILDVLAVRYLNALKIERDTQTIVLACS